MKNIIRSAIAIAAISSASVSFLFAADVESGAVDIGQMMPAAKGEFVEVNLSSAMLKFAAKMAARQEPEAAELIANLKSIRVNVVSTDDTNREDTLAKIEAVRRKLEGQGWAKMVTVREGKKGDNVDVHVKQRGDNVVDGIVVTVIDGRGQAVFVNIVGNIDADQIAKIADKFDIDQLRGVQVKRAPAAKSDSEV